MKLQINLNEEIFIKLTGHGRIILDEYLKQFECHIPKRYLGEDVRLQLWEFASIFGEDLSNGAESVSEDNCIAIQV